MALTRLERRLLEKIRRLAPRQVAQIEEIIDSLVDPERARTVAATRLSEDAFRRIWENPDDAAYDQI